MPLFQVVHTVTTVIFADNETQAEALARDGFTALPVEVLEDAEIECVQHDHDSGDGVEEAV
jgi:hypothetical protein